ncbi:sulfotransferase [Rhodanobacter sp. AS-Z3]|uniref:tetratricopeptide repeat-containing sulfotransferase family protein n=1 Tax=Rhodanobacter sp. AS-Z3 TaxID=3031330 RepID=UPI00247AAE26|nr:tetratricopeptide repeat-containing sulfotransferase family protein [Rhodanobacter sp. AS-Z3]WEN15639.1 sulfotransferase [Rhodanobacter sp. AS-Z3]
MNSDIVSTTEAAQRDLVRHCMESEQWDAAQSALESLLCRVPDDIAAWLELANVLFKRGQLKNSSAVLLQIARRLPRDAAFIVAVAERLVATGEVLAARSCLDLLSHAPTLPAEILVEQAQLRLTLGEIEPARLAMEKVISAGVNSPGELNLYAMLLQFQGEFEKARVVLHQCLRRWPHYADAEVMLVTLGKQNLESGRLDSVRNQLQKLPLVDNDCDAMFVRAEFEYAQFKILDDLGQYVEAWPALERCNMLMHELNHYDAIGQTAFVDALIAMESAAEIQCGSPSSCNEPTPIFIVGMPRTGSTLLERALSRHSAIASAGELMDFWRQLHWSADVTPARSDGLLKIIQRSADIDYAELGARYLKQTQWRAQGRKFYIDKLPANIQMVAFIRRALPHAPILHMVRDPMDTCFSNFKAMFGNVSSYSYDLQALAHFYNQYARLTRHWHEQLPGAMLDVSYAALVSDPQSTLRAVLERCGLAMEESCLHPELNASPVATPSSAQVRESIHTRGLDQWRQYAKQLEPLRAAIGAV